ncbi:MAG TPA: circadian clock KaiB family protein [Pseudomonadales bacterium]|nr:circadian clock KaiB family protein [Pseudomonadales bacterium]
MSAASRQSTALDLVLFIGGPSAASARAEANLRAALEALDQPSQLRIVDVLDDPGPAMDAGVLLTPTLVISAPGPVRMLVGDLSRRELLDGYLKSGL